MTRSAAGDLWLPIPNTVDALPKPLSESPDAEVPYFPAEGLVAAAHVAILLGQPLLLTGEPGTGKTTFAFALARRLGLAAPLVGRVKSTTTSKDLVYDFDELARFRDSHGDSGSGPRPPEQYLSFRALGMAILLAGGQQAPLALLSVRPAPAIQAIQPPRTFGQLLGEPHLPPGPGRRTVVLIDELDKAPRDTPNDLLDELDAMSFDIPEVGVRVQAPRAMRPIVVVTSNSERSLPEAFLRRCVYYDLPFPDDRELVRIATSRIELLKPLAPQVERLEPDEDGRLPSLARVSPLLAEALDLFHALRDRARGIAKPPATAELLAWLRTLTVERRAGPDSSLRELGDQLALTLPVLMKTREDMQLGNEILEELA